MVLEGGRGGGQPARIYSSQERSRSEALKLYELIGKYPLKKKKEKENIEGEKMLSKLLKNILDSNTTACIHQTR